MQFEFEFFKDMPPRAARPERLFFGLFPDSAASIRMKRSAERFICENHLEGKQLRAERLHVSLHHIGDYKRLRTKFTYAAERAGKAISMRPFNVTFRFITSFERAPSMNGIPRRWPLVLLGEGNALFELHKILGAAMEKNGLRATNDFTPHMTLLYGSRPIPLQAIEPVSFAVREFALIHSQLWLTRYNIVDRWSLEG